MYQYIYFKLFCIALVCCISCVYNQNFHTHEEKLEYRWNNHRELISKISYYKAQGNIVYTDDHYKKIYVGFVWTRNNNNNYSIKLFNVFGLVVISISVENGIVHVLNNITYQDKNIKEEIQKWIVDIGYLLKQSQQWILGLPGSDSKYRLNSAGYLSYIHCFYNKINIFIYLFYCDVNNTSILPKVLEVYCNQHHIKLTINDWTI